MMEVTDKDSYLKHEKVYQQLKAKGYEGWKAHLNRFLKHMGIKGGTYLKKDLQG